MFLKRPRFLNLFLKLPVLILYLAFFVVQIFFNLDIAQKTVSPELASFTNVTHGHIENIKQEKTKPFPTKKIRLNKRFHPSTAAGFVAELILTPVEYAPSTPTALSPGNFYTSVFLSSHALRGPPVIA